jgi:hypothetical protein
MAHVERVGLERWFMVAATCHPLSLLEPCIPYIP